MDSATEIVRAVDFVECFLFPLNDDVSDPESLSEVREHMVLFIGELTSDYIWHKDPFKLQLRIANNNVSLQENASDLPSHIYGICFYGDNVDDEWFVVYLVKEITKKFTNFAAKLIDSDGEFLLIEAANSLPSWAEPSNSMNRVFFYGGSLLLIPPEGDKHDKNLSVKEALNKIIKDKNHCLASNDIVEDISLRIDDYPEKIKSSFHRTTVYTPVGVAGLLKDDPSLISAAVHAFCTRDPIDMKACRAMKYFPPENRVNTSVTFTKCLYAMLTHNNFYPDRRTGWNLPLPNSPQYKSHSLGVKVACGFEILLAQAKPSQDLNDNRAWQMYLSGLKKRNYFQNLLEHSKQYNILLENAKDFFVNNLQSIKMSPIVGSKILEKLNALTLDEKYFKENEQYLPKDDDDSWLCVDPKELESMLEKRYARKEFSSVEAETDPAKFTGRINEFLEHISGLDGVEFPASSAGNKNDDPTPVRPPRGVKRVSSKERVNRKTPRDDSVNRRDDKIDFDVDQFSNAIQNILDLVIPEDKWDSDSESDLSEYDTDEDIAADIVNLDGGSQQRGPKLRDYMEKMDMELSNTTVGESFKKNTPRDVDESVLANMRESVIGEGSCSGPAGNILGPLGYAKTVKFASSEDEID